MAVFFSCQLTKTMSLCIQLLLTFLRLLKHKFSFEKSFQEGHKTVESFDSCQRLTKISNKGKHAEDRTIDLISINNF